MVLKEILEKLVADKEPVLLSDGDKNWEAKDLLDHLSTPFLKRPAFMQKGMYIAEIDPKGYLGAVMYKIITKVA